MSESAQRLLARIRLGEDSLLELKEVVFRGSKIQGPDRKALADEVAAFANSRGGTLVLGVHDRTREITGIPLDHLDAVERYVTDTIEDSVEPPPEFLLERLELPDSAGELRPVLHVEVAKSLFVHQSPSGYLRRSGSSRRQLKPEDLARLFQQRSQVRLLRFDEQVVPTAAFADLEPGLLDRFRTGRTEDDAPTFAHKLGMARPSEAGEVRPTVAGVLLGSSHPERWLRNAFIQAVAYRGRDIGEGHDLVHYQLDARDIVGPLDRQVAEACHFVNRNQKISATKTLGRRDTPQYDLASVFEGIVNAVAHRDYSLHGSKIRLRMFADRLEICSPGALVNALELKMLPYRQATRNEAVTSLLAGIPVPSGIEWLDTERVTLMDRRGEGVNLLLGRSERHSGRRPEYRLLGESELRLTIFAAGPVDSP